MISVACRSVLENKAPIASRRGLAIAIVRVAIQTVVALGVTDLMPGRSVLRIGALAVIVVVADKAVITVGVTYRVRRRVRAGCILPGRAGPETGLHAEHRERENHGENEWFEHNRIVPLFSSCAF